MNTLSITIADSPTTENRVAEIWDGNEHVATIDQESDRMRIEIYFETSETKLVFDCDEFIDILIAGRDRLKGYGKG